VPPGACCPPLRVAEDGVARWGAGLRQCRLLSRPRQGRDLPGCGAVDAAVLPTRGEGWGRPHVEAMAAGLPVSSHEFGAARQPFSTRPSATPSHTRTSRPYLTGTFAGHLQAEPDTAPLARAAASAGRGIPQRAVLEALWPGRAWSHRFQPVPTSPSPQCAS